MNVLNNRLLRRGLRQSPWINHRATYINKRSMKVKGEYRYVEASVKILNEAFDVFRNMMID